MTEQATFKAIDHQERTQLSGHDGFMPENVVKIIERATIIDTSGLESKLDGIIQSLAAIQPTQAPQIWVKSADPVINNQIIPSPQPVVNIEQPSRKVEPKNNITVMLSPIWLAVVSTLPAVVLLADLIVRMRYGR
jgi:hypothetical protein